MSRPDISVVVCTYNRAALLRRALLSLFAQKAEKRSYEVIVIDNNSADDTPRTVEALQAESPIRLRSYRETQQGNAYARNAGVEQAEAPIVAFLDDDVEADENWVGTISSAFNRYPELSFVGGRILPLWDSEPPAWLTSSHWAPLALLDYGPKEMRIEGQSPPGLLTANIGVRREVFEDVGPFSPTLQRVKGSIGSMEDHEFVVRMCRGGKSGMYLPELITRAPVDPDRMTKDYHRRWHRGHGRFYALMNDPEWERSRFQLAGVPSHLYKETAMHAVTWCTKVLTGDAGAAFESECRLRFFYGFFLERATKK